MKTHKVYELINLYGTVEYVGKSVEPSHRYYRHVKCKPDPINPNSSKGLFYGRQDLTLNVLPFEFDNPRDAYILEAQTKRLHGLETTEENNASNWGKKSRKITMDQANELRYLYKTGNYTLQKLSEMFGLSNKSHASQIVNNKSYNIE